MGQIIKPVCVCARICLSVCLSVCAHSHGRSIFTKICTEVITPKSKNEFVGVNVAPLLLSAIAELLVVFNVDEMLYYEFHI